MKIRSLAAASLFVVSIVGSHAQFASAVVDYNSGTGFATGYTTPAAAVGAPSTGSSVSPFSPAYAKSQLVSIGAGGWLTLRFDPPILDNPANPYGLDFSVYGNTFFAITNGNYSGGGITSGALGGNNTGATTLQVSADGTNWFTLNPALAPTVDNLFPTDGLGDPGLPVNPALTGSSFAGLGLVGVRALYNGSAGGTGYDVAWAQDADGNHVNLPIVRFVRINVLGSKSEIDAIATVRGTLPVFAEDFSQDPLANGWQIFGNTNLFHWNLTNQNVEVTWDSTKVNSYLYHPLGTVLTRDDAFSLSFDLHVSDAVAFNYGQQLSVSLFNLTSATNASFGRATGNARNLFEFDYFPDTGYGPSMAATLIDTNIGYTDFYFVYANETLAPDITYHVTLNHAAGTTNLTGQAFTNGVLFTSFLNVFTGPITDFRLDTVGITCFQDDGFGDSILAHGTVDNFVVSLPPPPVQTVVAQFQAGQWQAQFTSRSNWLYTLECTTNMVNWIPVATANGTGTNLFLTDPTPAPGEGFYRVRANRP